MLTVIFNIKELLDIIGNIMQNGFDIKWRKEQLLFPPFLLTLEFSPIFSISNITFKLVNTSKYGA